MGKSITHNSESDFLAALATGPKTVTQLKALGFAESTISKYYSRNKDKIALAMTKEGKHVLRLYYLDYDLDKVIELAQNQEVFLPWYVIDEALETALKPVLSNIISRCTWNWLESQIGRSLRTKAERDIALKVAKKFQVTISDTGPDYTLKV